METNYYCVTCGKPATVVVNDHMHLLPARVFAICYGPLLPCPPLEERAFLFPKEADLKENTILQPNDSE